MTEQLSLFTLPPALPPDLAARVARLGCTAVWRDDDTIGGWVVSWPGEDADLLLGFDPRSADAMGMLAEWLDWAERGMA